MGSIADLWFDDLEIRMPPGQGRHIRFRQLAQSGEIPANVGFRRS
jgi:hypothetical protein